MSENNNSSSSDNEFNDIEENIEVILEVCEDAIQQFLLTVIHTTRK